MGMGILKNILLSSPSTYNERAIWGYQDFLAGAITTTNVTLNTNSNGVSAIFDSAKLINSSAALFRQDGISYAFTGTTSLFSSKITVVSQVGATITLNGIPNASWGTLRIWFQILSTTYPQDYTNPPLTVQSTVVTELGTIFEEEENKVTDFTVTNNILYPSTLAVSTALALKQSTSAKDASGGYAGLTLFKINFKNALNTFTSFFTNANTAARTYTFQDRDGTILDSTDLTAINTSIGNKQNSNSNLTSLASLTLPANGLLYSTGANTITTSTVTAAARTVLDDADTDSMLTTLAGGAASSGTGGLLRITNAALINPALGTPSALVGTNITGTATGLSIGGNAATATTATTANTVTTNANLTGAVTSVGNAALLGSFTSAELLAALSTKTGTGNNVFATSPTFVTPVLGTPASGNLANCFGYSADALPIGVSIQTLHTIKTDTATTTSSTYAAIAGISRAITPTDVNSKIRVTVVLQCGGASNSRANFRLFRGASQIAFANAAASRTQDTACFSSGGNGAMGTLVMEALDSPVVATSITYTVQWSSSDNVSAMYINRTLTDTALATFPRTISTIILSEIKG